jgi:hypothetical protein
MLHLPEIRLTAARGTGEAKLLIRASEEFGGKNTAVALVFDNSLSMNYCAAGDPAKCKYQVAYEVLNDVLGKVELKKGTQVSLWTYGGNGPANSKEPEDKGWSPFQTENWDPKTSPAALLRTLNPPGAKFGGSWNKTPMITTMTLAMDRLKNSGCDKKLLIVLTDGSDSFVTPLRAKDVKDRFDNQGVVLNVVLFRTDIPANKVAVDPQIRDFIKSNPLILPELEKSEAEAIAALQCVTDFNPPGAYFTADNRAKLQESLEGFLAQRPRLTVRTQDGRPIPGVGIDDVRVQPSDTPIERAWNVPEGFVLVRIEDDPWIWVKTVRDEVLLLDVALEKGKYQVTRSLASDSLLVLRTQAATEPPDWRLAVAQSVPARISGVSLGASLEDASIRRLPRIEPSIAGNQPFIGQIHPKTLWLELAGPEGAATKSFHVEFRRLADQVAPTWETYLPVAPIGAAFAVQPSTLRAWFREDAVPAITRVHDTDLVPGHVIDAAGTVLEFADVETHSVAEDSGSGRVDAESLTIRLKCPPGLLSRVESIEIDGGTVALQEEHRFYRSADRVTALYWPFNRERLTALKSITVQSIDGLKGDKTTRQIDLKLDAAWLGKADDNAAAAP